MNVLYLIGNGFDLNLGLNTGYRDFYKYYKSIESPDKNIDKLKEELEINSSDWSDLELAFGRYTKNIQTDKEFDLVFEDMVINLSDYLQNVEGKADFETFSKDKFFEYLSFPERSLSRAELLNINDFRQPWKSGTWNVDIITFNYTRIIEKLIGDSINKLEIGTHHNNSKILLQSINHIHGFTDKRMVLGVNDESQIKNPEFHSNPNILEDLIKSRCNNAHGHTIDDFCKKKILRANLICLFGCSIGDTDKMWWELIGERLKDKKCRLIIFNKGLTFDDRLSHRKARSKREVKKLFISKTTLEKENYRDIKSKIFVGHNTDMFDLVNA